MPVECHVDVWNGERISGWAFDADRPREKIVLQLRAGKRLLGPVVANGYRPDLESLGGDGHCAFELDLTEFPRGLVETLGLRVAETGQEIGRSAQAGEAANQVTRSPFSGLWIDRFDWVDVLRVKQREGLSDELAFRIFQFVRDGFVVLPQVVPKDVIDELNAEIERVWQTPGGDGLFMETYLPGENNPSLIPLEARQQYRTTKLLDAYSRLPAARAAASAPAVVAFLSAIFEEAPRAFQQLHFTMGSEQPIHKDTAYVKVDTNPMALAATWLALEDVAEGTGELEYHVGSHHGPDYMFRGVNKWWGGDLDENQAFLDSLQSDAETFGYEKRSFRGKAGDVLIWHADLAHGGGRIQKPGHTRRSLVTHYAPVSHEPHYFRNVNFQSAAEGGVLFSSQYCDVGR